MKQKTYSLQGGKVQFGSMEAKQAYILEGTLMDIDYVLKHGKDLGPSGKEHLTIGRRKLAGIIKQLRKHDIN